MTVTYKPTNVVISPFIRYSGTSAYKGYKIPPIIVNQDNQSTIKLISNGKSNSELTKHIQIGYYWVKDLIDRGLINIEYCPTEFMIADFFYQATSGHPIRPDAGESYWYIPCMSCHQIVIYTKFILTIL